jgi:hypothetical protein
VIDQTSDQGQKGTNRLSKVRGRAEIARLGSQARVDSHRLAKAIRNNFDYLAAIHQLTPPTRVGSESTIAGKLPGIYGETHNA